MIDDKSIVKRDKKCRKDYFLPKKEVSLYAERRLIMEQKPAFLDTTNGDFLLIKEVVITKETTYSSLRVQFPTHEIWEVGTGYYWIYFDKCPFEGKLFHVAVCFERERLFSIEFSMNERQTSWEDWSEAYELQTEKYYKQWLTSQIGEIHSFDWGSVGAYYDRKGGSTFMWITYKK